MLTKFKKAFARVALVALALQALTIGLVAVPVHADAATPTISTNLDKVAFKTGLESQFHVRVQNTGDEAYTNSDLVLAIDGDVTSEILSGKVQNAITKNWDNLTPAFDGSETVLYDQSAVNLISGYDVTTNYKLAFNTPGSYDIIAYGSGLDSSNTVQSFAAISTVIKSTDNVSMTTNIPAKVKLATDVDSTVLVDNTYGADHDADVVFNFTNTKVADITTLNFDGSDGVLTPDGTGVTADFPETISAGSDSLSNTFPLILNFATEKTYNYTITLRDQSLPLADQTLASVTSSVIADGHAPKVKMTSKPVIVNNVTKAIVVTFTGNENMTLVTGSDVKFTQGLVSYIVADTASNVTQSLNQVVVTIPGSTFTAGTTPIDVDAQFVDTVGNVTVPDFTGQIQVDTIAPLAVTNLVATVDDQGFVVLSWTDPAAGTYVGLEVKRDGAHLASLAAGTTTYTDTTAVAGQTYSYTVSPYDEAGNETTSTPVVVSVPSNQIAAAVSDNNAAATTTTPAAAKPAEKKTEPAKSNENEFPWWGIVILIILAIIGGWLIYSQKPAQAAAPNVPPVSTKKTNSRSNRNTKRK
jgi:hypothetical protein